MGRTNADGPPDTWPEYFAWASKNAGYQLEVRGESARLSRDVGETGGQVSRWMAGRVPAQDYLRRLSEVWKRPLIEVYVAAGYLSRAEARLRTAPAPQSSPSETTSPDAERVSRLLSVIEDPEVPDTVRQRIRTLLDVADEEARRAKKPS